MQILQVTNFISHHQLPLARKFAEIIGADNFRFAATEPLDDERERLGWKSLEEEQWILRAGERDADRKVFEQWWDEADVVISGERRFDRMKDRLGKGKLTFYMSERWWKPPIGILRLLHPQFAVMIAQFRKLAMSHSFHFLPIGYYATADMARIAPFTGRMWRWGYFTEIPNPLPSCDRDIHDIGVLWVGRMLKWKRVDTLIKAFSRFLTERPDSILTLVGDGPEQHRLKKLADRLLPSGSYQFLQPQPVAEVLRIMQQHNVYVLPSTDYEGWGAVVNEAMSAGCAVIASTSAGSAKELIRHGENGLLFNTGDWSSLTELLQSVGSDEAYSLKLALAGQRTITECWSPTIAAGRFIFLCDALLAKHAPPIYENGPMAPTWKIT